MAPGDLPAGAFGVGKFATQDGTEFPGLVLPEDLVLDVSASFLTTEEIFDDWDRSLPALEALAADNVNDAQPLSELRPLPPLATPQVFQAGANFRTHVIDIIVGERYDGTDEMSEEDVRRQAGALMDKRAASGIPYVFPGLYSALTGADDPVVLPDRGEKHDWELELAVVFGKAARNTIEADALDHVAGFMIANDVTTRDFFFRDDVGAINVDFIASKNQPTFSPVGPYVLPRKFAGDLDDIRITLKVNGQIRQDETLDDMIYGVEKLIAYTSTIAQIHPGDILMCGSPAGNGAHWRQWLKPGDTIEATITGLGTQHNTIQSEEKR
jgi:2-keto-4-pentenoate hydratase/2-oxohepta-3-ene-1,7-dioic acid hydratase in catechol pathway